MVTKQLLEYIHIIDLDNSYQYKDVKHVQNFTLTFIITVITLLTLMTDKRSHLINKIMLRIIVPGQQGVKEGYENVK